MCNGIIKRGAINKAGSGRRPEGGKSYDEDRHKTYAFCDTWHVELCFNKDRNCYKVCHTSKNY